MKLLTVDIESPIPDIPAPTLGEQWVLVRLHRQPLGMLTFAGAGCRSDELARMISDRFAWPILRHRIADSFVDGELGLDAIPRDCPRLDAVDLPRLTVAVCTRNGADRLSECLESLSRLRYPSDRLDVVIVDNASSDDATRLLIEGRYPSMRYVPEPRPGLDWARNRAILEARGDIVAFTDDDVSVDEWWAEAMARVFAEEPEAQAVTGLVVPDEIDVDSQRLFERYGGFGRGFARQYFRVDTASGETAAARHGGSGRFGTGANMAFRRSLFGRIGLFDPALDVGTATNGGGDLEMFFRVLKTGGTLVYEPSALARHRHRRTYGQLRTQLANNGVGFYSYLVRSAQAYPDERRAFARLGAWWLWWWNGRRLARSLVRHDFPRDLILAELRGSLAGLRRYRQAQRQAATIMASFGPQQPYASTANGATSCSVHATGP